MSTEFRKRFGARIRELRKEKNVRQLDLAVSMGVEEATVSNIENGKKEPCLDMIEKLSKGLGVSLRRIFWNL